MVTVHAVLCFTQLTFGVSYILNKVALNNGMNKFVFSVYRDLVAIAVLSPVAFLLERGQRTRWTPKLAGFIILLGAVGIFGAQILMLTGLSLTSSGFTSIFQNATPVAAFLISIVFGLETIYYHRRDGQAKLLGVLSCISGALVASLLKGPAVVGHQSSTPVLAPDGYDSSWKLGALCLMANSVCMGTYINLQAPALRRYPAPISLTALSYFFGATILALVGLITVKDLSAWKVTGFMDVLAFVYAGCISSGMNFALQTWCVQKAGPFIVIAYFPLQAIVATLMSWLFLHEALHLGSLMGGVLIIGGLYLVTWGQVQQQRLHTVSGLVSASVAEPAEPFLP